jgi:translocation and assembly module TamA
MGPTRFVQSPRRILRDGIVEHFVYWDEGSYYHQGKLDRLRESLARLDYFSSIDIEPRPQDAVDGRVPTTVTLVPAKRSIYTAGLSYGTDSGAGVRLGVERRYVNDRGHKALAQVDWAVKRKTLTTQYRIPAFGWIDGWYTLTVQAADEQTDYIDNRQRAVECGGFGACAARTLAVCGRAPATHRGRRRVPVRQLYLPLAAG